MEEALDEIADERPRLGRGAARLLRAVREAAQGGRSHHGAGRGAGPAHRRGLPAVRPRSGAAQVAATASSSPAPTTRSAATPARLVVKTGVTCPKCKQGQVVERRSKKGRTFYGCERYPECDFVVWQRPLPAPCPDCGGLVIAVGQGPRPLHRLRALVRPEEAGAASVTLPS